VSGPSNLSPGKRGCLTPSSPRCLSPVTCLLENAGGLSPSNSGVWPQQPRCLSPAKPSKQGSCLSPVTQMSVPQQLVPWKTRVPVPLQPQRSLRCLSPATSPQRSASGVWPQQLRRLSPATSSKQSWCLSPVTHVSVPPATCPLENAGACPPETKCVSPETQLCFPSEVHVPSEVLGTASKPRAEPLRVSPAKWRSCVHPSEVHRHWSCCLHSVTVPQQIPFGDCPPTDS
jgi:hypothetical protein